MRRYQFIALILLSFLLTGCATRKVMETVYIKKGVEVELRGWEKSGEPVDQGYQHPASVSPQRLASVLASIEVRGDTGKKEKDQALQGIVTSGTINYIAAGMSEAFREAGPSQEVVVKAIRKNRRLMVFSRQYYTGFTAYMKDNYLYIHISHVDREVDTVKDDTVPEPRPGEASGKFRVVTGKSMHAVGPHALAVRWRDPRFANVAQSLDSKTVRTRTILMESPVPQEEIGAALPTQLSDRLSPETLRQLADLEEERRKGLLTEDAYMFRRDQLLRGEK